MWRPATKAKSPLVIAHRGASLAFTENTEAAFVEAERAGADGVELDIRQCASGELMVFHDADLARLAGRKDTIASLSLAALREVRCDGGGAILTLHEAIDAIGENMVMDIELKADRAGSAVEAATRTAALIAHRGQDFSHRVVVSSFDPTALLALRVAARRSGVKIATALLFHGDQALPLREGWAARLLRSAAVAPHYTLVGADSLARWRRAKLAVWTWTVDKPARISALAALGVDAIITNDPRAARRALV